MKLILLTLLSVLQMACGSFAKRVLDNKPDLEVDISSSVIDESELKNSGCSFTREASDQIGIQCEDRATSRQYYSQRLARLEYRWKYESDDIKKQVFNGSTSRRLIEKNNATWRAVEPAAPLFAGESALTREFYSALYEIADFDHIGVKFELNSDQVKLIGSGTTLSLRSEMAMQKIETELSTVTDLDDVTRAKIVEIMAALKAKQNALFAARR